MQSIAEKIAYLDFDESMKIVEDFKNRPILNGYDASMLFKSSTWLISKQGLNSDSLSLLKKHESTIKEQLKKLSKYALELNQEKILLDLEYIKSVKKPYCSWYMSFLLYFKVFYKNIDDSVISLMLEKRYMSILNIINTKELALHYDKVLAKEMINDPTSLMYVIEKFDLGRNHYIPHFTKDQMSKIIDNYLSFDQPMPFYLEFLMHHRDNNGYTLTRRQKVKVPKVFEYVLKNGIMCEKLSGTEYNFEFDDNQNEPLLAKRTGKTVNYVFSKKYIDSHLSNIEILNYTVRVLQLVDKFCFINDCYLPNEEGILFSLSNIKGPRDYGSDTFRSKHGIHVRLLHEYYAYLKNKNISLEKIINWYFNSYLYDKYKITGFKCELIESDEKYSIKNRNLFAVIEDVLKMYQIYVEEGEISSSLIGVSLDNVPIRKVPTLCLNKYYQTVENKHFNYILNQLFSSQSFLKSIFQNVNFVNFLPLIYNYNIYVSMYKEGMQKDLQELCDLGFIKIDKTGRLLVGDKEKILVAHALYRRGTVSYWHLNEIEKKVIIEFEKKGWVKSYAKLFSDFEAKYLSYCLRDDFDNGLGLRNKYLHGNSLMFDENGQLVNYIFGLKILLEILHKINDDILLNQHIKKINLK